MTKAQKFVPFAVAKCLEIRTRISQLQEMALALKSDYNDEGGATMDGLAAFDFSAYATTLEEFTTGMTELSVPHNAVALSTVRSGGAFNAVTKIGLCGLS
jgi:hypothetical protein